jgi:hypothetical protein
VVGSQLSEDVVVQTVYHSWVKRKLSTQEQANVLDFPVDRTVKMTDEELLALTRNEIPGKILTAASWFLKEWGSANSKDASPDETTIPGGRPPPVVRVLSYTSHEVRAYADRQTYGVQPTKEHARDRQLITLTAHSIIQIQNTLDSNKIRRINPSSHFNIKPLNQIHSSLFGITRALAIHLNSFILKSVSGTPQGDDVNSHGSISANGYLPKDIRTSETQAYER